MPNLEDLAYLAYSMFTRSLLGFKERQELVLEGEALRHRLFVDVSQSNQITAATRGFQCQNATSVVSYELDAEYIVRTSELQVDSFYVVVEDWQLQFEKQQVKQTGGLVDFIDVQCKLDEETLPLKFVKSYGALDLMRLEQEEL